MKAKTKIFFVVILCGFLAVGMNSCKKKSGCTDPGAVNYDPEAEKYDGSCEYDLTYDIPETYNFDNVMYGGQTVRLLLLKDLTSEIAKASSGTVTESALVAIYENSSAAYSDIASDKNLSDKTESNADAEVRQWFKDIEALSSADKGYTTDDGVDLKQMVEKTLMGAVFFNQAADGYLQKVESDENSDVVEGKGTTMEHHWDEAFGYFGAARDFNSYSDADIKSGADKDSNGDGTIDPELEKNFYYAQTAAKRDIGAEGNSTSSQTDYTKGLFDAWLKGRAAISNKDYEARDEAKAAILENWQKIIAATVVHYINDTQDDIESGSSDLNKHWAEMKAYFNMLEYYSGKTISDSDFNTVNSKFGDSPTYAVNNKAGLDEARTIIKNAYGFTDEQVSNW